MVSSVKQRLLRVMGGVVLMAMSYAAFALPAFPTSGTCAMLVSHGSPEGVTVPFQIGYSTLAEFTFTSATAGTFVKTTTKLTYAATGPTVTANTSASGTFALTPITTPAGMVGMLASASTGDTYNLVAVNGGNTILVQGVSNPSHGVCQF